MKVLAIISALMVVSALADTLTEVTHKVFFDMTINGQAAGRIVFGMFGNKVPKTANNFTQLAAGYTGNDHPWLSYKGSFFHRIIPGFMAQGGDFNLGNGNGGHSIFGSKFNDESFDLKHSKPYLLSMANSGPDTNTS